VVDSRHRLVVVELVTNLAEKSSHRDDLLHAYHIDITSNATQGEKITKIPKTETANIRFFSYTNIMIIIITIIIIIIN